MFINLPKQEKFLSENELMECLLNNTNFLKACILFDFPAYTNAERITNILVNSGGIPDKIEVIYRIGQGMLINSVSYGEYRIRIEEDTVDNSEDKTFVIYNENNKEYIHRSRPPTSTENCIHRGRAIIEGYKK